MIAKFARFAVVGSIGYLVDAGVLTGLVLVGIDRYSGRLVSFSCSVFVTWLLNRRYVFHASGNTQSRIREFIKYVASSAIGGGLNLAVYAILVGLVPAIHARPWVGVAAGSVAGMVANFLLYDRAVFGSAEPRTG